MRISSDPSHPAFSDCASMCRIFLDGVERNNVITADEEGRIAVTQRLDVHGHPALKAGKPMVDEFCGAVRIECPAWLRQEIETGKRVHGPNIGS